QGGGKEGHTVLTLPVTAGTQAGVRRHHGHGKRARTWTDGNGRTKCRYAPGRPTAVTGSTSACGRGPGADPHRPTVSERGPGSIIDSLGDFRGAFGRAARRHLRRGHCTQPW